MELEVVGWGGSVEPMGVPLIGKGLGIKGYIWTADGERWPP